MYFNSFLRGPHSRRQHWILPLTIPPWLSSGFFPALLISNASRTYHLWIPPRTISIFSPYISRWIPEGSYCCLRRHREFFTTFYRFSLLLRTVSWTSVALQRSAASKVAFTEGRHWSWSPVLSLNRAFNTAQEGRERNFSIFQTLTSEAFLQTDFHKYQCGKWTHRIIS